MNRFFALASFIVFLIRLSKTQGEKGECQDLLYPTETYCEHVDSWSDFVQLIDESVPGDELYLCPFDIEKSDPQKVNITWGISIICVLKEETDSCTLRGTGGFMNIATDDYTLFQSFHFRDSDDHAVHIESTVGESSLVVRTFCHCTFSEIRRELSSRGGAFMAQESAGVINLYYCQFLDNYTLTRGAAVYTRTNQMNVVGCEFIDNESVEWGAAIFASQTASLYVERSIFTRNLGLNDYGVVVKPNGSSVWTDGGNNLSNGGKCAGFYLLQDDVCQLFIEIDGTPSPSNTPTPTSSPTTMASTLCSFDAYALSCLQVDTFAEIKEAILGSPVTVFCGGFEIEKPADEVIDLSSNHEIRCVETCTISGLGTHLEITGAQSQVRVSNIKFALSDSSAVRVSTSSTGATTTFCNSQFFRNTATLGGAIWIAKDSGSVNVVGSTFARNEAVKGGAIYGGAQLLLILDSLFVNNVAVKAGSAVFTYADSTVVFHSSYFAQNSVSSSRNYAVVAETDAETRGIPAAESNPRSETAVDDDGENLFLASGSCNGLFIIESQTCKQNGNGRREKTVIGPSAAIRTERKGPTTIAGNGTVP